MRGASSSRFLPVFFAALLALAGCGRKSTASGAEQDAVARRAAVESTTTAFHQALRTNDSTALLAYVADDVVMIPPGEPAVRGKQAMREWYAGFLSQYHTSSLQLTEKEVFVGDGWAVELGAYEWGLTPAAGGAPTIDKGHYMQVWKSGPDGRWRFAREIWNSAAPATPPAAR